MDARRRLFAHRKACDAQATEGLFVEALRENLLLHQRRDFYARWLSMHGFDPGSLHAIEEIENIPPLPAAFFKRHGLAAEDAFLYATSSGTQGEKSQIDLDRDTFRDGYRAAMGVMRHHGFLSPVPARYIVLSFPPRPGETMGAVRTAMGVTRLAPALSRVFALRRMGEEPQPDVFGVLDALRRYAKGRFPVRLVGFPAYLYHLCRALGQAGERIRLPKGSLAMLGGGWKGFAGEQIPAETLRALTQEHLGLPPVRVRDFYSALEHPIAYAQCRNHHMHVPIHSRVIIRHPGTLAPLPDGEPGLLSFVTPLPLSMPLSCVLMGDLAVRYPGKACGCGIETPYFEVLGRAGSAAARNCAVSAADLLGGANEGLRRPTF